ncbi:MAG: hypothetical protein JSV03_11405, partial [Planctomycetota bacterium]
RVTTVRDEKVRQVPFEYDQICKFYGQEVLPEAVAQNNRLTAAMGKTRNFVMPEGFNHAMQTGSPNHRRFAQDIVRELQYQDLRQYFMKQANRVLAEAKMNDLRSIDAKNRAGTPNSQTAWRLIKLLEELDVAYGQGEYDRACGVLSKIAEVKELFSE